MDVHDLEPACQRGPVRGIESRDPRVSIREHHAIEFRRVAQGDPHAGEVARGLETPMGQHATQRASLLGREFLRDDDVRTAASNQIRKRFGISEPIHQISRKNAKMRSHFVCDQPPVAFSTNRS
jgi:hypothetical protein